MTVLSTSPWPKISLPYPAGQQTGVDNHEAVCGYLSDVSSVIKTNNQINSENIASCIAAIQKIERWIVKKIVKEGNPTDILNSLDTIQNDLDGVNNQDILAKKNELLKTITRLYKTVLLQIDFKENENDWMRSDKLLNIFLKSLADSSRTVEVRKSNLQILKNLKSWGWKILTVAISLVALTLAAAMITAAVLFPIVPKIVMVSVIISSVFLVVQQLVGSITYLWPEENEDSAYLDLLDKQIDDEATRMLKLWKDYKAFSSKLNEGETYLARFAVSKIKTLEDLYKAIEQVKQDQNPKEDVA